MNVLMMLNDVRVSIVMGVPQKSLDGLFHGFMVSILNG